MRAALLLNYNFLDRNSVMYAVDMIRLSHLHEGGRRVGVNGAQTTILLRQIEKQSAESDSRYGKHVFRLFYMLQYKLFVPSKMSNYLIRLSVKNISRILHKFQAFRATCDVSLVLVSQAMVFFFKFEQAGKNSRLSIRHFKVVTI